jgi:hypothetical protein
VTSSLADTSFSTFSESRLKRTILSLLSPTIWWPVWPSEMFLNSIFYIFLLSYQYITLISAQKLLPPRRSKPTRWLSRVSVVFYLIQPENRWGEHSFQFMRHKYEFSCWKDYNWELSLHCPAKSGWSHRREVFWLSSTWALRRSWLGETHCCCSKDCYKPTHLLRGLPHRSNYWKLSLPPRKGLFF